MRKAWHWISLTDYRLIASLVPWWLPWLREHLKSGRLRQQEMMSLAMSMSRENGAGGDGRRQFAYGDSRTGTRNGHGIKCQWFITTFANCCILRSSHWLKGDLSYWLIGFAVWFKFTLNCKTLDIIKLAPNWGRENTKGREKVASEATVASPSSSRSRHLGTSSLGSDS